jgi:hypothetical protein
MYSTTAIGVGGFESPSDSNVLVFVEAELSCTATKVESFVVARSNAALVLIAPSGTTLAFREFERRRGGSGRQRGEGGNERELHGCLQVADDGMRWVVRNREIDLYL